MKDLYNRVVVTGGSGFLGKRLKLVKNDWIYLSSKDIDLTKPDEFFNFLKDSKADAVVHLAAKTGGIKHSVENQSDFHYYNSLISTNVLKQAKDSGVKRVLSCLSTCCYPDIAKAYPMKEEQFLEGEPTSTNYGYALAKRELFNQTNFYRKFYNLNYSTFTPCNLYGPDANFNEDSSHFIASLLKKIHDSRDGEEIVLYGSGKPLRQHLYIDDLAEIVPILLNNHNTEVPINVSTAENLSIKDISEIAVKKINKNIIIKFNNNLDGQMRKDVDNTKLLSLIGNYRFTTLDVGLKKTYHWYMENIK